MSKYYGNILEDATIELSFNTFNSDGASVTVTDLATTDVEVYKDGTILADPDAGVSLSLNVGTGDGSHLVIIDTSADAEYTTGSNYEARLVGITVDSQTINAFVGSFSIENRFMRGTDGAAPAGEYDTQLDANMSSRAPSGEYDTQLDANMSSRAPSGEYDTQLDANISTRAPASEYDTEMARITANVATEAKQDIMQSDISSIGSGVGTIDGKIGTPANIDTGGATLADNLKKMADDNNGATFDAATDSLNKIRDDRTLAAADYTVVGDLGVVQSADNDTKLSTIISTGSTGPWTTGGGSAITQQEVRDAMKLAPTAGSPAAESVDEKLDGIESNFFPDEVFVPAAGTIRYNKKGTVTQLSKKDLKDPSGNAVNSTEDIIAEATEQ